MVVGRIALRGMQVHAVCDKNGIDNVAWMVRESSSTPDVFVVIFGGVVRQMMSRSRGPPLATGMRRRRQPHRYKSISSTPFHVQARYQFPRGFEEGIFHR